MDEFTHEHLDRYLSRALREDDDIATIRENIIERFEEDPDYWSRIGWPEMLDRFGIIPARALLVHREIPRL